MRAPAALAAAPASTKPRAARATQRPRQLSRYNSAHTPNACGPHPDNAGCGPRHAGGAGLDCKCRVRRRQSPSTNRVRLWAVWARKTPMGGPYPNPIFVQPTAGAAQNHARSRRAARQKSAYSPPNSTSMRSSRSEQFSVSRQLGHMRSHGTMASSCSNEVPFTRSR